MKKKPKFLLWYGRSSMICTPINSLITFSPAVFLIPDSELGLPASLLELNFTRHSLSLAALL